MNEGTWLVREFAPNLLRLAGMPEEAELLADVEPTVASHPVLSEVRTRAEYAELAERKEIRELLPGKVWAEALSGLCDAKHPLLKDAAGVAGIAMGGPWPGAVLPWGIGAHAAGTVAWKSLRGVSPDSESPREDARVLVYEALAGAIPAFA